MRKIGEGRWRWILLLTGLLAAPLAAHAVQTTSVQDKLYRADGALAQGTLLVSWSSFTAADGSAVAAGSKSVAIANDGSVALALVPNAGADPAGSYYTAVYHLSDGTVQKEYWVVPQAATVTIAEMRAKVVPAAVAQQSVSRQYVDSSLTALQTQLTEYVNTHPGSGPVTLPTGLVKGNGTSVASPASASDVTALFHSMVTGENYYLQTSFNEGAAGATLAGTRPATYTGSDVWHFAAGDAGTAWNFQSGGGIIAPNASSGSTGGPYIDIGHSDYTLHLSVANVTGYLMVMLRYTDTNNMVFVNLNGNTSVSIYNYVNGDYGGAPLATGNLNFNNLTFTVAGSTITATGDAGQMPIVATLPGASNLTATKVGFTLESSTNAVISSLSVSGGTVTKQVACAGYTNADGTCSTAGSNNLTATDANGHLAALPEIQTFTDGNGNAAIACQEDMGMGRFDARCSKYGGGIYGATPGAALQQVADAMTCYMAQTGKHASLQLPSGTFPVGTPSQPTLLFGSGAYINGVPSGTGSSTILQATYNNHRAMQVNTGRVATCSDGQPHTDNLSAGITSNLAEHGCGDGACVNLPGDTGSYPNGGPLQDGIFVGDSQGEEIHLAAYNNGGTGIECSGQDSHCAFFFTQLNNEWYLYGKNNPGQSYDPTTDGLHADIILSSIDGQFDHMEAYGTQIEPGTEYGHVALLAWGGGNSQLTDAFLQVGEIGMFRGSNGGFGRFVNSRIDYSMGESIVITGGANDLYSNLTIDGYCSRQSVVTALGGYCDGIDIRGANNTFTHLLMASTNGQANVTYATGDLYAFNGGNFGPGTEGLKIDNPSNYYHGQAVNKTFYHGTAQTAGDYPDVSSSDTFSPQDSTPTVIHGVGNAFIGEPIWVILSGGNDTLQSSVNGGHWHTCSGNDLTQPGLYHFVVTGGTIYGDPAELQEQCDPPQNMTIRPVPASSTESCNDADFTFGAGPAKVGGFGIYRCHPANTWTFYALTGTSF